MPRSISFLVEWKNLNNYIFLCFDQFYLAHINLILDLIKILHEVKHSNLKSMSLAQLSLFKKLIKQDNLIHDSCSFSGKEMWQINTPEKSQVKLLMLHGLYWFVFEILVISQSIPCSTKLVAIFTLVTWWFNMCCLNMFHNICLVFGGLETIVALPISLTILGHLRSDQCIKI